MPILWPLRGLGVGLCSGISSFLRLVGNEGAPSSFFLNAGDVVWKCEATLPLRQAVTVDGRLRADPGRKQMNALMSDLVRRPAAERKLWVEVENDVADKAGQGAYWRWLMAINPPIQGRT
jgi:hypothetical protein